MKKVLSISIFYAFLFMVTHSLHAQDGLAIGGGYRQSFRQMFVPIAGGGNVYGITFGADYTTTDLCGPLDFGAGVNISRTWRAYFSDDNEAFVKRFGRQLWSTTCSDIQIPLYLRLSHEFGNVVRPFLQAGPTLSLGITHKDGFRGERYQFNMYKSGIDLNPYGVIFNRFDVLVGGSVGVVISGSYRLMATVEYGLLKRIKENHCNDSAYFLNDPAYKDDPAFCKYLADYANKAFSSEQFDPVRSHNLQLSVTFAYVFN